MVATYIATVTSVVLVLKYNGKIWVAIYIAVPKVIFQTLVLILHKYSLIDNPGYVQPYKCIFWKSFA